MHYYETIEVCTFEAFLQEVEKFKSEGYRVTHTNTNKSIVFDGKNTIECRASVSATLEKGTATYIIVGVI